MKHADQNELDLLLRSLARNAGVSSARSDDAHSEHLDADELNAFAEGVLPEAARVRYAAHLADCPGCRGIVINLNQAAGIAVQPATAPERSPSTLLRQLSALFSQPVLRFVLPAIVLASILGIGLMVMRQNKPGEFIAKHEQSEPTPILDQTNRAQPAEAPLETQAPPPSAPTPVQAVGNVPADAPKGEGGSSAAGARLTVEPPPVARKEVDAQPAEATPTFAPDVAAPASAPPLPAYSAKNRTQTLAKEEAEKREAEVTQSDEVRVQTEVVEDRNKPGAAAKAGTAPARRGNAQGLMSERNRDEDKNKEDSSGRADSRTVSGKRFVRRNNLWVDSTYDSSKATTSVRRGSEQYRALVADEPGIRAFAEQLSGEVIVVWKGRAYRFH